MFDGFCSLANISDAANFDLVLGRDWLRLFMLHYDGPAASLAADAMMTTRGMACQKMNGDKEDDEKEDDRLLLEYAFRLAAERDEYLAQRDTYLKQRDIAIGERNELRRQLDIAIGERANYLPFRRDFFATNPFRAAADFSMANSSSLRPCLIRATSQRGRAPRPAHVSPPGPRYFGGTLRPFIAERRPEKPHPRALREFP